MRHVDVNISTSYARVRRIARRSRSSFYRSFWLLPPDKRMAMCSLYAFARITDDIGDCDAPVSLRRKWLQWWRQMTALNLLADPGEGTCVIPEGLPPSTKQWPVDVQSRAIDVLPSLRHAAAKFGIPSRYLLEIVDGVLADQKKTRFDTFEQLEHYCYLVASAVGLACLHVWGFDGPLPTRAAIDCGLAFQLTNILRDITEDATRGRIYLPQQHWNQHDLCEDDLLRPRPDDRLRCLILDEVRRASDLYDSGWKVWDSLHPDGQRMFSMMWRTYRQLLSRIEADPNGVLTRRISLSKTERWNLVSSHFIGPIFRRLPVPPLEVARP